MELTVTKDAAKWYKNELELQPQTFIRFFPRYGFGGHIPGFSIGISRQKPIDIYESAEVADITFFIEDEDAWYFEDGYLIVQYDDKLHEATFSFETASSNH